MVASTALQSAWAQAPAQPAPVFGAGTIQVLVDAVVTDRKDRPIRDLRAGDFRVYEDGALREIVSFVAFGAPRPEEIAPPSSPSPEMEAPAAAPLVPASTVLFVDEGHLTAVEAARLRPALMKVVRSLLERRGSILVLAPWSKVAYAGRLPGDLETVGEAVNHIQGRRVEQLSTFPMTDAEALEVERGDTQALTRLIARFQYLNPGVTSSAELLVRSRAEELSSEERARRRDTFEAMGIGFAWLARQPGRHTFLMVTSGFVHDATDPGFAALTNESMRANAPIHFLDAGSPQAFGRFEGIQDKYPLPAQMRVSPFEAQDAVAGSDQLAVNTGGLHIDAADDSGLERIMDATRHYYILGYDKAPGQRPGFRRIKVEVTRKDARVRSRRGYFDEGPKPPLPSPSPRS